jgi:UDP-N-acetylglucosamine 2-epimerase (non-hydrolysing)
MIDTLFQQLERAGRSEVINDLALKPREFAVLTLHRPSNVDEPESLRNLFEALSEIARRLPVIFPAHPRTQARIAEFGIDVPDGVRVMAPLGYLDFLRLWSQSRLVMTDSGGLQEETTALGIPCLTLRENTERPITVAQGTNRVVGRDRARILEAANEILAGEVGQVARIPELWDGHTAERIVDALITRANSPLINETKPGARAVSKKE